MGRARDRRRTFDDPGQEYPGRLVADFGNLRRGAAGPVPSCIYESPPSTVAGNRIDSRKHYCDQLGDVCTQFVHFMEMG